MKVFDDHEGRLLGACLRHKRCGDRAPAAVPCDVIHRVIERAPLAGLRQVQKVAEERQPFG
jgi:hypothetical protein